VVQKAPVRKPAVRKPPVKKAPVRKAPVKKAPVRKAAALPKPAALDAAPLKAAGTRESGWVLLALVTALLVVIGLMMVLSASSVEALRSYGGAWVFFQKQAMWVAVGAVGMGLAACWDYRRWSRLAWPLVVFSLVLLVAVQFVGINVSGSTRWLGFGGVRFQPSEMAKLALLIFVADLLGRRSDQMHESRLTFRPVLVVAGAFGFLVMLQPDMGTAMVLVLIVLVELFVAGMPLLRMAAVFAASTAGAAILAMGAGYRRNRVFAFVDPWGDVSNTGYQVAQSLVALGTGHVAGVGLGASRAKWGFLPNAHTDFIFAIVGEELGLVGTLLVLLLFAAFAVLGIRAALRAPDRFGTLMAAGITTWVVGQALVNMGAVTGMLPVTGVPLPFLSFGGTSLVVTMVAVGVLLNIARHSAPHPR
jgi:cell division protein FtsW